MPSIFRGVREVTVVASVLDVAAYILEKQGAMSAMKLQKLCYYSKAWHLVWESEQLFPQRFEAWANGPVAPTLYGYHRRQFNVDRSVIPGDPKQLTRDELDSIDTVLDAYGDKPAYELSAMTHREKPWIEARGGLPEGERCQTPIDEATMYLYYDGLAAAAES